MGAPEHYSLELPERCLHLIEELWPEVERVRAPGQPHRGPLTTTFLLAMSTPIITLPIERIQRHLDKALGGYIDDRSLNGGLASEVRRVFNAPRLETAPFFNEGRWRFATTPYSGENLALHLPDSFLAGLRDDASATAAAQMPVSQWASCLRNALAHGGVLYLDREGYQALGRETEMLAFVSGWCPDRDFTRPPERLNILRITEADFRDFLRNWVGWLSASGLSRALAA